MIIRCPLCVVFHPLSVVRPVLSTTLQRTSPKLLAGFWPNLVEMILIWPSLKIVQMVLTRSHRLKIDFQDKNKSFDIWYVASPSGPLPSLFKLCPWPRPRGHMFNTGLYRENMKTSSLKPQDLEL